MGTMLHATSISGRGFTLQSHLKKFHSKHTFEGCDTYNTFPSRVGLCNCFAVVDFSQFSDHKIGTSKVLDVCDKIQSVVFSRFSKHQSNIHNTVSKLRVRVFFS